MLLQNPASGLGDKVRDKYEKSLISVSKWLHTIGLEQYLDLFTKYKNVQDMVHLTETDLKNLGVKNGGHRARIASSLYLLRERMAGKVVRKHADQSPVHSNRSTPTHTPPSLANHPDYALNALDTTMYQPLHQSHQGGNTSQKLFNPIDFQLHNQKEISKNLWYHGPITRLKAESLLKEDGNFLIRDSTSKKGDYVLTCYWHNGPLHFMVNRQSVREPITGLPKTAYQFEDVLRDTVPQLISYYVKEQKPISEASMAKISSPVNRRISADSLSLLSSSSAAASDGASGTHNSYIQSSSSSPFAPTLGRKPKRAGSQPLLSFDDDEGDSGEFINHHKQEVVQGNNGNNRLENLSSSSHIRSESDPVALNGSKLQTTQSRGNLLKSKENIIANSDSDLAKPAPPKPSRIPTIKLKDKSKRPVVAIRNKELYDNENDYSDYDAIKSWPKNVKKTEKQDPMFSLLTDLYDTPKSVLLRFSDARSSGSSGSHDSGYHGYIDNTYDPVAIKHPDVKPVTKFDLSNYNSQILTPNNKPLEKSAVPMISAMILTANARNLALHMTLLDLDLLKIVGDHDLGLGVKSGLELITLPHGSQLRKDTLERFHCMKLFVATTILLCTQYEERAKMLHQWIQIAQTLKTQCGNLFAFAYVMEGITFEQIKRLKNTWITIKHHNQSSLFLYESKLQSAYKSLCNASNALPLQNITLPYILPLVDLLERDNTNQESSPFLWEQDESRSDGGMDVILKHLDIARIITQNHALYKVTSTNILGQFKPVRDLLEVFDTRMHLKFMWGAKGAQVKAEERYGKFMQILTAMSGQREPLRAVSRESSL